MVKLTGPGLAKQASGSVAGQLTFSNWKGKPYLKKLTKPKQPRAPGQVAMRTMMTFLSQEWAALSDANKLTWAALADASNISDFNAYQRENLARWRNFKAPTQAYPAAETGLPTTNLTFTATGGVRHITLDFNIQNRHENWSIILSHVSGSGVNPTWQDAFHAFPTPYDGDYRYIWTPLPAGTYWATLDRTTTTGKYWAYTAYRSAVVTD